MRFVITLCLLMTFPGAGFAKEAVKQRPDPPRTMPKTVERVESTIEIVRDGNVTASEPIVEIFGPDQYRREASGKYALGFLSEKKTFLVDPEQKSYFALEGQRPTEQTWAKLGLFLSLGWTEEEAPLAKNAVYPHKRPDGGMTYTIDALTPDTNVTFLCAFNPSAGDDVFFRHLKVRLGHPTPKMDPFSHWQGLMKGYPSVVECKAKVPVLHSSPRVEHFRIRIHKIEVIPASVEMFEIPPGFKKLDLAGDR